MSVGCVLSVHSHVGRLRSHLIHCERRGHGVVSCIAMILAPHTTPDVLSGRGDENGSASLTATCADGVRQRSCLLTRDL